MEKVSKNRVRNKALVWIKENKVLVSVAVAIVLGICLGLALRHAHLSYDAISWIKIWGELFLRMIKLIVLPLVMACIVVGEYWSAPCLRSIDR